MASKRAPSPNEPPENSVKRQHIDDKNNDAENVVDTAESGFELSKTGPEWGGIEIITDVVVFGDSTTRFGKEGFNTWFVYFLRALNRGRNAPHSRVRGHCYAAPGATVEDDLGDQITQFFEDFPRKATSSSTPSLNPNPTLYVFWLGINDCGRTEPDELEEIVEQLINDGLDEIWLKAGGRNFLIFDVPPKDRSPGGIEASASTCDLASRYTTWNSELLDQVEKFTRDSAGVSCFLFTSFALVTDILDHPEDFGFDDEDVTQDGGAIWYDELHMASKVHKIIAEQVMQALTGSKPKALSKPES